MPTIDELFIRKYDDLLAGLSARDAYESAKLSAHLRHLLLDSQPLVHQANRPRKLKIKFSVAPAERYEVGDRRPGGTRYTLSLDANGDLACRARFGSRAQLTAVASGFFGSALRDTFCYISWEVCYTSNEMLLSLYVNNRLAQTDRKAGQRPLPRLAKQVIAADLSGRRGATCEYVELVLAARCLTQGERKDLARYFWYEWHD